MLKYVTFIFFNFILVLTIKSQVAQITDTVTQTHHKNGKIKDVIIFVGYTTYSQRQFLFESFNESGQLTKTKTITSDTIESNLTLLFYYNEGEIKEKFFRPQSTYLNANDYYTGYSISYYKNGKIKSKGMSLLNNGLTGLWIYYYDNGNIKKQGWWKNFKKIGKWDYYNKNGNLVKTKEYEY